MLVRAAGPEAEGKAALLSVDGVHACECLGSTEDGMLDYQVELEKGSRAAVFEKLAACRIPVVLMKPMDETLEDIFLRLTQEEMSK